MGIPAPNAVPKGGRSLRFGGKVEGRPPSIWCSLAGPLVRRKALQKWLLVLERQEREVASPRPLPRHLDEDWEKVAD